MTLRPDVPVLRHDVPGMIQIGVHSLARPGHAYRFRANCSDHWCCNIKWLAAQSICVDCQCLRWISLGRGAVSDFHSQIFVVFAVDDGRVECLQLMTGCEFSVAFGYSALTGRCMNASVADNDVAGLCSVSPTIHWFNGCIPHVTTATQGHV